VREEIETDQGPLTCSDRNSVSGHDYHCLARPGAGGEYAGIAGREGATRSRVDALVVAHVLQQIQ
jgi:hypothetical protein